MTHRPRTPRLGAFTLIELLFIVATISILAAIAVPNFLEAQTRVKVDRTARDMAMVVDALEAYDLHWDALPPNLPEARLKPTPSAPDAAPSSSYFPYGGGSTDWRQEASPEVLNGEALDVLLGLDAALPHLAKDPFGAVKDTPLAYWRFDPETAASGAVPRAILISLGPNTAQESSITTHSLLYRPYDPTNGTNSEGDLAVTIPQGWKRPAHLPPPPPPPTPAPLPGGGANPYALYGRMPKLPR